jgi:beta-glucanase (GH16 family)
MKKQIFLLTVFTLIMCVTNAQPQNWKLVWGDEFNYRGLPSAKKWSYDTAGNISGWGNNEHEWYTAAKKENAFVCKGVLKITAHKVAINEKEFTSARIYTKNKFDFNYGKVEVKAKLPKGGGTWPAIWMLGSNIDEVNWPACGEIDIMEHLGNQLDKIYCTFHYPERYGSNADGSTMVISNATTAFHIYSLEWTPEMIKLFVDGALVHSLVNSNNLPYHQKFFLILNLAMGGNFGGAIDPLLKTAQMEVDYVRVYQKK